MRRSIDEGDVVEMFGEKVVCVFRNKSAAKVVSISGQNWKDPEFSIDVSEPGSRISAQTSVSDDGYIKLLGKLEDSQLKRKSEIIAAPRAPLGHDYIPFPGTAPKQKKKVQVEKSEIHDEDSEVLKALENGASEFVNLITSKTVSPGSEPENPHTR